MYIVAIAWLYVVVLMAATENSVLAGLSTLVFYGLLPCGIVMYLLMAPRRAKIKQAKELAEREKMVLQDAAEKNNEQKDKV